MSAAAKPSLLFLCHRIPFPPDKGDKIRSFHLLQHMAGRYRVFLATFIDDPCDRAYRAEVEAMVEDSLMLEIDPLRRKLCSLRGLLDGQPLTLPFYPRARMQRWVDEVVRREGIQRIVAFSSAMAQYVLGEGMPRARRIMDFIDVDSDKWCQYAQQKSWPMRWVYQRECARLAAFERRVAVAFDASVLVSEHEAGLFRELAPAAAQRVHAIANGVDRERFDPQRPSASPYPGDVVPIVFVGAMDYWPNVDAVDWFARAILPLVRDSAPTARFYIVGSNPAPKVSALAALPGVEVTGRVDDVRPWVAAAAVSVAPLRIARGIQNKVLESLAMARPTVVTTAALEGIPARPGEHLLLADDAAAMADAVLQLVRDPALGARMGAGGRTLVADAFDWERNLQRFVDLVEGQAA